MRRAGLIPMGWFLGCGGGRNTWGGCSNSSLVLWCCSRGWLAPVGVQLGIGGGGIMGGGLCQLATRSPSVMFMRFWGGWGGASNWGGGGNILSEVFGDWSGGGNVWGEVLVS